jgi:FecR-like protein
MEASDLDSRSMVQSPRLNETQNRQTVVAMHWGRLLASAVLLLWAVGARAQEVGTIAELDGTAEIGRGGAWTAASVGAPIQQGDRLRTKRPGRLRVVFQDDSVLTLSDNSELVVDQQVFDPAQGKTQSTLRLLQGKVLALASEYYERARAVYEIRTKTAVAGVRGTEFAVYYDPRAEVTEVVGVHGRVEVHSVVDLLRRGAFVTPGELTSVAPGEFPALPAKLSDRNFRQYIEGLEFVGAGRLESLTIDHPVLAGATVPQPDRAPAATAGGLGEKTNERMLRDASDILKAPPESLGKLRIRLF